MAKPVDRLFFVTMAEVPPNSPHKEIREMEYTYCLAKIFN